MTFTYRKNNAGPSGEDVTAEATIDGVEFLRRYLEHVMPKGFGRVRFYGWWSTGNKGRELPRIRAALGVELPKAAPEEAEQKQQEKTPEAGLDAPVRRRAADARARAGDSGPADLPADARGDLARAAPRLDSSPAGAAGD